MPEPIVSRPISLASPFVSVIVIVLNGADKIGVCLYSLMRQSYPSDRYEVIVVDNGSTDATREVIENYDVIVELEPIRGRATARNRGVAVAKGEIVAFTDSDCVPNEDWLEMLIRPYSDPEISAVAGEFLGYPSENPSLVEEFIERAGLVVQGKPDKNGAFPFIVTRNASYTKEILESAGLFDVKSVLEDVDMSRQVQFVLGAKAALATGSIVYHRHPRSILELARFLRRDGYAEIVLAARWRYLRLFDTTLAIECGRLLRQFVALGVYAASLIRRLPAYLMGFAEIEYVAQPALWFVAEGSNVIGKAQALIDTRLLSEGSARRIL